MESTARLWPVALFTGHRDAKYYPTEIRVKARTPAGPQPRSFFSYIIFLQVCAIEERRTKGVGESYELARGQYN